MAWQEEVALRQQIATTVLITMGKGIRHFEGTIDPKTGTVMVDWMFSPIEEDDELHEHIDEDERRIKSHAIMRVYCAHVDPRTGSKFSYLLGSSAIDLAALMQHNIHVNSGLVDPEKEHQYDFAIRTNFSNTFVICTVLPFVDSGLKVENSDLNIGEAIFRHPKNSSSEVMLMKQQLEILRSSSTSPSVLKHLPDVETMVKLQQGLQHVYCAEGIKRADAVLSEPNGLAYAQGSTYLQTHMAGICFSDVSQIVRSRVARIPNQQIMIQMYAAMCTMGLKPSDLVAMEDHQQIFEFIKASVAASTMDAKQTPYYSDYVIHSVLPVENEYAALANLQPIPGTVEYAPGCSACIYKQHEIGTPTGKKAWFRLVLSFFFSLVLFHASCMLKLKCMSTS